MKLAKDFWRDAPLNFVKGALIGVGAILPGISGGALCAVFGIYKPMMSLLSHPIKAFRQYAGMLLPVLIGLLVGFLGLARAVDLMFRNFEMPAVWLFIGLILGTFPAMYRTAGEQGRTRASWVSLAVAFVAALAALLVLNGGGKMNVEPTWYWWVICGALWGIGIIVPGMSASAILIFLGMYQPLTAGVADLSMAVLIPFMAGIALVVLALARAVNVLLEKAHSVMFHALLGVVAASTVMIVPLNAPYGLTDILIYVLCFGVGLVVALWMDKLGAKKDEAQRQMEAESK